MVTKKIIKSRRVCKLIFKIPVSQIPTKRLDSIAVAGDFNDWHIQANPMTLNPKESAYQAEVEVANPGTYQFRYVVNGRFWLNDGNAEGYTSNGYGEENCLVHVEV